MQKTLYLHMGVQKTGSSALQSFFVNNRAKLHANNITYFKALHNEDNATAGKVSCGNAREIGQFLRSELDTTTSKMTLSFFDTSLKNCQTPHGLFSNEGLIFNSSDLTSKILQIASKHDFSIKAVLYVRSITGVYISSYGQHIKSGKTSHSFTDYIDTKLYANRIRDIIAIINVLGKENVIIRNYDTHKNALASDFISNVLSLNSSKFQFDSARVNRSLTRDEIHVCRKLNTILDYDIVKGRIGDCLIYEDPNKHEKKLITIADLQKIRSSCDDAVQELNSIYPDLQLKAITDDIEVVEEYPEVNATETNDIIYSIAKYYIEEHSIVKYRKDQSNRTVPQTQVPSIEQNTTNKSNKKGFLAKFKNR